MEESWTELNPRIENLAMNLFSSRGMASASNSSARKVVKLQEMTLCECSAPGKMQICVEVACTMLCTIVVLVLANIKCVCTNTPCVGLVLTYGPYANPLPMEEKVTTSHSSEIS